MTFDSRVVELQLVQRLEVPQTSLVLALFVADSTNVKLLRLDSHLDSPIDTPLDSRLDSPIDSGLNSGVR